MAERGHHQLCQYQTDDLGIVEWCTCTYIESVEANLRERLRAQVEALRGLPAAAGAEWRVWDNAINSVLALLDGAQ